MTNYQTSLPAISDGLDDYDDSDSRSIIRGMKLKFSNDAVWLTGGDEPVAADREFVVVEIMRVYQKWIGELPVETCILAPDEPWPDIDALNKAAPPEEWTTKFDKQMGPWRKCYVVYLLDAKTLAPYTFPTSTDGGGMAVRELRTATRLARRIRGPGVFPKVTLSDMFMKTRYGGRQRPHFNIVDIVGFGGNGEVGGNGNGEAKLAATTPKQIEHTTELDDQPARRKAPPKKPEPKGLRF
jgi:hypothetical protein